MKSSHLPIYIVVGFMFTTLGLYNFGPIDWHNEYQYLANLVVLSSLLFLIIGYRTGFRVKSKRGSVKHFNVGRYIRYGSIASVLTLPFSIYAYTGGSILDVSFNVSNQGQVHREFYEHIISSESSVLRTIIALVRTAFSPVIYVALILGMKEWSGLTKKLKWLVVAALVSQFIFSFSRGTDKEIVDFLIFFTLAMVVSRKTKFWKKAFRYGVIGLLFVAFFNIFMERRESRYFHDMTRCFSQYHICVDTYGAVPSIIGEANFLGLSMLDNYLTQGYHGMSLAMRLDYEPMYGLGHIPSVARLIARVTGGGEFFDRPYNRRLNAVGWDYRYSWSSLYTWFANDVTFYLVPFSFLFIGFVFGRAWREVLTQDNPVSYMVTAYLFLLLIYSPANNQLGLTLEMYFGFSFWVFWWWLKRVKYRKNISRV